MDCEILKLLLALSAFFVGTGLCAALDSPPSGMDKSPYVQQVMQIRDAEAGALRAPDGWLSLVALREIFPGSRLEVGTDIKSDVKLDHGVPHTFILRSSTSTVQVLEACACVMWKGTLLQSGQELVASDDLNEALRWDTYSASVINREGHLYLRIRDAQSKRLSEFHGLSFFPINIKYRITAEWIPYRKPRTLVMTTQTGQNLEVPAPGYARFMINGVSVKLEAFELYGGSLAFLFRDMTSDTVSYGAGRELYADPPLKGVKEKGAIILDFNEAFNPPCAYTPFGTCPMPPPGNRLHASIPAGERRYHEEQD